MRQPFKAAGNNPGAQLYVLSQSLKLYVEPHYVLSLDAGFEIPVSAGSGGSYFCSASISGFRPSEERF
jgi:hypothetical protein